MLIKPPEETGLYLIEPEELEKQTKLLIILQKETNFLKRTLPYWKNWKKTERLQHSPERAELLIILQKESNVLKKMLPYWKNWKKTERNFLSRSRRNC